MTDQQDNPPQDAPADPDKPERIVSTGLFSSLVKFFVQHKNAANLLMISMLMFGFYGMSRLNTQFFPTLDVESVNVTIIWPGASSEDVDINIVEPVQAQLRYLDNVDELESLARPGIASFTVYFKRGSTMSKATADVDSAIDQITTLPSDIERPIVKQFVAYDPVGSIRLSGDFPERVIKTHAQKIRKGLLAAGVDRVNLEGARDEEIWIEMRIDQMRRYNLTVEEIADAIRASALDMPGGLLRGATERQIRAKGLVKTADEISRIEVRALPGGERILVRDVARVTEGFNSDQATGWVAGKSAVKLAVFRSKSSDALTTLQIMRDYANKIEAELPQGMDILVYDTLADKIAQRLEVLLRNGVGGMILVMLTLFLFLNIRIAVWVALGVPIAILMTLGLMWPLDRTINMLSMFTFIMTLGIIVDDAIVVGEHSATVYDRGEGPEYAAERGALRMSKPIFAAALTTLAAFMPILLVDNVFGDICRPIPIVVLAVLVASLVECFFILPSHLKHALSKPIAEPSGFRKKFLDNFDKFRYGKFKQWTSWSFENRYTTFSIALAALIVAFSLVAGGRLEFRFFPAPEMERIKAQVIFHSGTARHVTKAGMEQVEQALYQTDRDIRENDRSLIAGSFSRVGTLGNYGGNNLSTIDVELIASEDREVRTVEFIQAWKDRIPDIAGLRFLTIREENEGPGSSPIEVRLQGGTLQQLKAAATEVVSDLERYPGVFSVYDNLFYGKQELLMDVNAQGAAQGFTNQIVGMQLRNAYEGAIARRFARDDNEVTIRVLLPRNQQANQNLEDFFLAVPGSRPTRYTPLLEVVNVKEAPGFTSIRRAGGEREVTIRGSYADNAGNPMDVINHLKKSKLIDIEKKYGVKQVVRGEQKDMDETLVQLGIGLLLGLSIIYMVLAVVFSSYSRPIVIMSVIPFGLVGAFVGHYVQGFEMNFLSLIALLGLSGILVNNSIILVSRIDERHMAGEPLREAVINGVSDRLRAVMLTSLTTVLGLTPMLFETSSQAQFLLPMVVTMAWGLASSSLLVLFLLPSILGIQQDLKDYLAARRMHHATAQPSE